MVWSTLPDGYHDYYNAQWYEFTGVSAGSTDGDEWNGMFHPEDQPRAWKTWQACLASGEPYFIEYRLRHRSGEYRWTIGRAQPVRDEQGEIIRWMGTCTDIHEAKQHAAHNDILSRELSHRIKNIFAVISGLVGLSARHDPAQKAFAAKLQERVAALGRAHEFVRPHSEESLPQAPTDSLHGILIGILSPYPAMDEERITIEGPDVRVDDRGATPLALLVHELATNAMKYGALMSGEGRVRITTRLDGDQLDIAVAGKRRAAPVRPAHAARLRHQAQRAQHRPAAWRVDRARMGSRRPGRQRCRASPTPRALISRTGACSPAG